MPANNKHGLGRGLGALLGEDSASFDINALSSEEKKGIKTLKVSDLSAGIYQPRKAFNDEAIDALAQSIKEKGVLQPILVRRNGNQYEIIAGERRFRAAKLAGLQEVPVIEKELEDNEVLEIALIENIVRENLTAIEEAAGLNQLISRFGYKQERLAEIIGKSRSYIANTLRLLTLPETIKTFVNEGSLSAGHARALIGLTNAEDVARQIIEQDLNVRQTEKFVNSLKITPKDNGIKKTRVKDGELSKLEEELCKKTGFKIQINSGKKGKGRVILSYDDLSQLEMIIEKLEK